MKVALLTLLVTSVLTLALAVSAQAFVPHVGDRAAELAGRDVRTGDLFSLNAQQGRWVFVDFWAYT
jgi:hypothetical protein